MKNLTMYALVLGMSTTLSFGTGATTCTGLPTSENQTNNEITNNSAAIDIINLSGTDCAGNDVNQFKIIKLPDAQSGILYMADGVTPVRVGQLLTKAQADGLKFDPADGFKGTVNFVYAAIDDDGQGDNATITLPIVDAAHPGGGNGGACNEPTTNDLTNPKLQNNLPATDILNLSGQDCAGNDVNKFKIKTLPDPKSGTLYMADGKTPVRVGQVLTQEEADGLKFDPADNFVGDVSFTYSAIDGDNHEDVTPATVTLPIVGNGGAHPGGGNGGNGGGTCNEPITDDKDNPKLLNTLAAVNILNLSGHDCADNEVKSFEIKTLPAPESGILYMADGKTPVRVGQVLTREEADGLRFDPAADFVGNATFTYVAIDNNGVKDLTPATVSLPIVAEAGVCTEPITDDKDNPKLLNTLGAVNILNLSGHDCAGHEVESFEIKTLPDPKSGILYMADGVTPVRVGQVLTREEADGLRFDPADGFVGDAIFTYVAIDENTTTQDLTPATVTIPVVANGGGNADCTCDDYESSVPSNTPFGLILMFLATLFIARKSSK